MVTVLARPTVASRSARPSTPRLLIAAGVAGFLRLQSTSFLPMNFHSILAPRQRRHEPCETRLNAVAYEAADVLVEKDQQQEQERKRIPVSQLSVGQMVEGAVKKVVYGKGVIVDVGAETDGFLPATEFRDGFPTEVARQELRPRKRIVAKIMSIDGDRFYLTRRSVDSDQSARDNVRNLDGDASAFKADAVAAKWLEGEVVSMTFNAVFVSLTPSNGGNPVSAILQQGDFAEGFVEKVQLGSNVRVRVKLVDERKNRVTVTMKDPTDAAAMPLEVGQALQGTVVKIVPQKGVLVDVGAARPGFLGVEEFRDGFPKDIEEVRPGTDVEVRVLAKDSSSDRFYLTRRSGALERPPKDLPKGDVSPFAGVSTDRDLDAEVVFMNVDAVFLTVSPPGGGEPVPAILHKDDMTKAFFDEVAPGGKTTVQLRYVDEKRARLSVTMKGFELTRSEDLQVGESVKGTVKSMIPGKGVLVDIGATRLGLLPIAEFRDGFPTNAEYYRPGAKCNLRILSMDGDRLTFTRRSGELSRPQDDLSLRDNDISAFDKASSDTWFDAEVVQISLYGVFVKVTCPTTGLPVRGMVHQKNFDIGFVNQVYLGMPVRVRVLSVRPEQRQLDLSMV